MSKLITFLTIAFLIFVSFLTISKCTNLRVSKEKYAFDCMFSSFSNDCHKGDYDDDDDDDDKHDKHKDKDAQGNQKGKKGDKCSRWSDCKSKTCTWKDNSGGKCN
jgi:hypothetical protein